MKEWIELVSSQIVHLWIMAGILIAWNIALSIMVLYAIHRKPNVHLRLFRREPEIASR